MELDILQIHTQASKWDVTKSIAAVLHNYPGPDWFGWGGIPERPRKLNFRVILKEGHSSLRNNGTGLLTVPSQEVGERLLAWLAIPANKIRVLGKPIKIVKAKTTPSHSLRMILEKAPYVEPDKEERLEQLEAALHDALYVNEVQIGMFSPGKGSQPGPRFFSVEFSESYAQSQRLAMLKFEWKSKQICLVLGHNMLEHVGNRISIPFSSVAKIEIGQDFGMPFVCFELLTPPVFDEFNLSNARQRRRVASLNDRHASIAPYAHHLRILLYESSNRQDPLQEFIQLCKVAKEGGLRTPCWSKLEANSSEVSFSAPQLRRVRSWLLGLDWDAAFQIELLLHNGLVNTRDLMNHLKGPIDKLCRNHRAIAGFVLRHFVQALRQSPQVPRQVALVECFKRVLEGKIEESNPTLPDAIFSCHHVTVTPTRLILEGPYAIQSNRIIREYKGFDKHFLRVDFRDEDRLPLRWSRDVDGSGFLSKRVGGILKTGLELAGRRFEFLAYSSSALRSHAVWFMTPFEHPELGSVTSDVIRGRLGIFEGTQLVSQPSKYAARLALAFTATDPSVSIERGQWEEIPDLGLNPDALHTDGCGTISMELRNLIWDTLCMSRGHQGLRTVKPSVFQVRFLGYKGVVSVDRKLEGIKMRLRPSMKKFDTSPRVYSEIEIARAFEKPNACYLNRPLIMVLEDLGVKLETFLKLAKKNVEDARAITESFERFCEILLHHDLGDGFRLASTLSSLESLGLDSKCRHGRQQFDDPFLRNARKIAMNHVLRGVKHNARIRVPNSWLLVGVADEGPAYENMGFENVYCLKPSEIYACVQSSPDEEPVWLQGPCILYRCPVVHPGDVLSVNAVGKPPERLCLFAHLKNAVVLPSRDDPAYGYRSLASRMGGGDVDGDLFCVVQYEALLPPHFAQPASYPPGEIFTLDRPSTVHDICDFIVEYIHSDVLGLLSIRHLVIADQSKFGTRDNLCLRLADMCSSAVDYPKNGIPVNIDDCPRLLIPFKPDWHASEVPNPHHADFYESTRAIGHLYRSLELEDISPSASTADPYSRRPLSDAITKRLDPLIRANVHEYCIPDGQCQEIKKLFQNYADELQFISITHVISQDRLLEEEIVVGTILAKCTNRKSRSDRIHSMQVHSSTLVNNVQRSILPRSTDIRKEDLQRGLMKAWVAWDYCSRHKETFGATSFGLIALDVIFFCLKQLGVELGEGSS